MQPHVIRTFFAGVGVFGAALATAQTARPPAPDLSTVLTSARHTLVVSRGELAGDGAAVLRDAFSTATYIAIGEDHVTREIPLFVSKVCEMIAPRDLSALVLEMGPEAGRLIDRTARRPDRLQKMAALNALYPGFVAFLDTRDDNDMAARCASLSRDPKFHVFGLDQEYIGSAGFLLDLVLREPLRSAAAAKVQQLRSLDRRLTEEALASGDANRLLLATISDDQLDEVDSALRAGGSPRARALFAALRTTAVIYRKNRLATPDSNLVRALLMKRNLAALPAMSGKTIFKFGDWHLYKGVNPLGERDIGNFIAERAEGRDQTSLHILVLGAKGVHAYPTKFGAPLSQQPFRMEEDRDYAWFKRAIDLQTGTGWTLFDLRSLRHRRIRDVDPDWRRVIDGYDIMVVVPELTPSETIVRQSKR